MFCEHICIFMAEHLCVCVYLLSLLGSRPGGQTVSGPSSPVGHHLHVSSRDSSFLFIVSVTDIFFINIQAEGP